MHKNFKFTRPFFVYFTYWQKTSIVKMYKDAANILLKLPIDFAVNDENAQKFLKKFVQNAYWQN